MLMETIEVNRSTESQTQATIREPLPAYNANGEDVNPSTLEVAGPKPRPVTAATAQCQRLWKNGILVLVGEDKSYIVGPIDKDLVTEEVPSNPTRKGQRFCLRPDQELLFVPFASEETNAGSHPPLYVHRRRTVVCVRPDTASRYGDVYKLLMAAEQIPSAVGEDLDRLTWVLVYGSIEVAKRAERILREAGSLAE